MSKNRRSSAPRDRKRPLRFPEPPCTPKPPKVPPPPRPSGPGDHVWPDPLSVLKKLRKS